MLTLRRFVRLILLLGLMQTPALQAFPSQSTQAEISHLLDYVAKSGCSFYRNGIWHDPLAAQQHLSEKYAYFVSGNSIWNSEQSIEKVATQSSFSGLLYKVKCVNEVEVPSAQWLLQELVRYRTFSVK